MRGGARAGRGRRDALCASAAPRPARASALAAAAAVAAVILALVPVGVGFSPAAPPYVHMSEAYAATPVQGAGELLSVYAKAAGVSETQLITGVVTAAGAATGLQFGNDAGIALGNSASESLGNLVDAADYPDYNTLSEEDKRLWGSKDNYDAAKFNSLLDGLGFGDLTSEYYRTYSSSGGGTFEPDEDQKRKLGQLGRIATLWANGAGNALGNVRSLFSDLQYVQTWPATGTSSDSGYVTPDDTDVLPDGLGADGIDYLYGTRFIVYGGYWTPYTYQTFVSDRPVYMFALKTNGYCSVVICDENGFSRAYSTYSDENGNPTNWSSYNVDSTAYGQIAHNFTSWRLGVANAVLGPVNVLDRAANLSNDELLRICAAVIGKGVGSGEPLQIPDYVPDEPVNVQIYMPKSITPETKWSEYTQPGGVPVSRPENPYNPTDSENPANTSGTTEWQNETSVNVDNVTSIRFDKLFPFSMLYDVPMLFDKVQSVTGSEISGGVYNSVSIPVPIGNGSEEMQLDLTMVHDFLGMTKPFFQILLVALLLIALIEFWRGILTGD